MRTRQRYSLGHGYQHEGLRHDDGNEHWDRERERAWIALIAEIATWEGVLETGLNRQVSGDLDGPGKTPFGAGTGITRHRLRVES